jgi:SPP1 gp7 family putative phage head morphogenesis protein
MTADNAAFIVSRIRQRDVYQPFYDSIIAVLRDIALEGAGFGRRQIETAVLGISKGIFDIDWELANMAAERWARRFGAQLIRGVTDTTRQRVADTVADWTTNNESIGQLAKRLAEPGGPFGLNRARTIAVTETTRAYAEGNMAAWRESKVIQRRRWNTNVDEAVCPICGPLHNVVVGLNESYPGGLSEPPAHPNCRCWITPVVEGAEERETGLGQFGLGPVGEVDRVGINAPPPSLSARVFASDVDAMTWGKANYDDWAVQLSEVEQETVKGYQHTDYKWINSELRTGVGINDESIQAHKLLDGALSSVPLDEPITVYKGVAKEAVGMIGDTPIGDVWIDNGYTSTTLFEARTSTFIAIAEEDGFTPALVEIVLPKGTRGAFVDSLWDRGEREFLVRRGGHYRVIGKVNRIMDYYGEERMIEVIQAVLEL